MSEIRLEFDPQTLSQKSQYNIITYITTIQQARKSDLKYLCGYDE